MGLKCQIERDSQGNIVSVLAPNGKTSILYNEAIEAVRTQQQALDLWSTAYIPEFKLYYGDWEVFSQPNHNLDENGEPVLQDILSFLESRMNVTLPVTKEDIKNVYNFFTSNKFESLSDLASSISLNFYIGGRVVVNRNNLTKSGLYTPSEIDRIMANPDLRNSIALLMEKIYGMDVNDKNNAQSNYYLTENPADGIELFEEDSYDNLGKSIRLNPYEVQETIKNIVGGIKDRTDFDNAFLSIPYQDLVDRYEEDSDFREDMYNTYSIMNRLDVVEVVNNTLRLKTNSPLDTITKTTYPNPVRLSSIRSDIDSLLSMEEDVWSQNKNDVISRLKDLQIKASEFGIDISGINELYNERTQQEFDDFLSSLDIFLANLNSTYEVDYDSFSNDYINFFNQGIETTTRVLEVLPNEENLSLVYYDGNIKDPVYMYENFSLLKLRDGVYQRVDRIGNISELYDTLYQASILDNTILPKEAYYPAAFGRNGFNPSILSDPNAAGNVMNSLKKYINSFTDFSQSEEMVLMKALFGHNLSPITREVDINRELSRFLSQMDREEDLSFPEAFKDYITKEKAKDSDLYRNVLSKFSYDPNGEIKLNLSDPITLKQIDLNMPEGSMRERLFSYAMRSTDPSMSELFFTESYDPLYLNKEFYQYLYNQNPELLPSYRGEVSKRQDGRIEANSLNDFIRVEGDVYVKLSQEGGISVYEYANQTPGFIMKDIAVTNTISNAIPMEINDMYTLNKKEISESTCG